MSPETHTPSTQHRWERENRREQEHRVVAEGDWIRGHTCGLNHRLNHKEDKVHRHLEELERRLTCSDLQKLGPKALCLETHRGTRGGVRGSKVLPPTDGDRRS